MVNLDLMWIQIGASQLLLQFMVVLLVANFVLDAAIPPTNCSCGQLMHMTNFS